MCALKWEKIHRNYFDEINGKEKRNQKSWKQCITKFIRGEKKTFMDNLRSISGVQFV